MLHNGEPASYVRNIRRSNTNSTTLHYHHIVSASGKFLSQGEIQCTIIVVMFFTVDVYGPTIHIDYCIATKLYH